MKYKAGDKVRVISKRPPNKYRFFMEGGGSGDSIVTEMEELFGQVVTIRNASKDGYSIEELGWHWTDEMFEGLVIDAEPDPKPEERPAFKVGDRVIGNANAAGKYCITVEGWKGTVTGVYSDLRIRVSEKDDEGGDCNYDVDAYCFDLLEEATPQLHTDWNWEDLF